MTITAAMVIDAVRIPAHVFTLARPVTEPKIVINSPTTRPMERGSPQNPNFSCSRSALIGFVLIFNFSMIHLTIMANGAPPEGTLVSVRLS